jgi:hypothetical protein
VFEMAFKNSIVSYPVRGQGGSNKWRGNWPPQIVEDILDYVKPKKSDTEITVCEVFAGSGTGRDVCRRMGYNNSIHLDLNPTFGSWNALKDDFPAGGFDLVMSHPPYHDMIPYSGINDGGMWGDEPHPDDLSRCATYEEFIKKLNYVNAKIMATLRRGGRHAILIGDMRRKGKYYSMIKDMLWIGDLEAHVIKVQHNCMSDRKVYANNNFIPIVHEHLLIFKNGEPYWYVNMKITQDSRLDYRKTVHVTWRDLVQKALESVGGVASLDTIYKILADTKKAQGNPNWEAKIRQTLQRYDEFVPVRRGVWGLQYSRERFTA